MFGFNIEFRYLGKEHSADVTCFDMEDDLLGYDVTNISPAVPGFPDPFTMREQKPDSLGWMLQPEFKDLGMAIAKAVLEN